MTDLTQYLQGNRKWLASSNYATTVTIALTLADLDLILSRLVQSAPDLPKIEPRLLHPQEPRGTKRSPEEVAQRLAEMYGQSEELRGKFLRTCA